MGTTAGSLDWAVERDPAAEQLVAQSYTGSKATVDADNRQVERLLAFRRYVNNRLDEAGVESYAGHITTDNPLYFIGKRLDDVLQASEYAPANEQGEYPYTVVAIYPDNEQSFIDTVLATSSAEAENKFTMGNSAQVIAIFHGDLTAEISHDLNGN